MVNKVGVVLVRVGKVVWVGLVVGILLMYRGTMVTCGNVGSGKKG